MYHGQQSMSGVKDVAGRLQPVTRCPKAAEASLERCALQRTLILLIE
jgi:hypothetical protein